jgi:poly(3-hydroxyalkanoate) synthetase
LWSEKNSGALGEPPPMGSTRYPGLEQAPGQYVRT